MNRIFLLGIFLVFCNISIAQTEPIILPRPQKVTVTPGDLSISKAKKVKCIKNNSIPSEGYKLSITKKGVSISYSDHNGYIYGLQTLEMLKNQYRAEGKIPCMVITDAPRVSWRSFLLDSGRQYQKPETIKKYIDLLSILKFNRFHWHLTEGLGWRMEIKQYPLLTQVGAFVGKGKEQQGFYTQTEIAELIQYAKSKGITIVPEIDMPGHAEAALIAYPELGCFGEKITAPETGFTQHIFCAGKPATIAFLKNVLDEVCNVFPSEYIHLGGDEAPKGNWDKCPDCQKKIAEIGLKDSEGLQMWFSAEMANHLKTKSRKAIFWDDIIVHGDYPLPDNITIHWWNWFGRKDLAYNRALQKGLEVICGTNVFTYLNYPVTPWAEYAKGRMFDMHDVYENNPSFVITQNPLVLGMSTSLLTDFNVTENMIDRRILPRIFALAQQMWYSGNKIPFPEFYRQVKTLQPYFEKLQYEFGPGLRSEVDSTYKWD